MADTDRVKHSIASIFIAISLVLSCGCSEQSLSSSVSPETESVPVKSITKQEALDDPLLLSLAFAVQDSKGIHDQSQLADLRAVILQQLAVGWAAKKEKGRASWAFDTAISLSQKTGKLRRVRLRGIAKSCLETGYLEHAVKASGFLRVDERGRVLGEAARLFLESGDRQRASEVLEEARELLDGVLQNGGAGQRRALREVGLAYYSLGDAELGQEFLLQGCALPPEWPKLVRVRNLLEIALLKVKLERKGEAREHLAEALALLGRRREYPYRVLAAVVLREMGEVEEGKEALLAFSEGAGAPLAAQGLAELGFPSEALDLVERMRGKSRAEGLYFVAPFLSKVSHRDRAIIVANALEEGKDWRLVLEVAGLCARTDNGPLAQKYFTQSLASYQKEWPKFWADPIQRGFVLSHFGRTVAECGESFDVQGQEHLAALVDSLKWPQEVKL